MKKLIALTIAALMVLSMIPAMAFTAFAEDEEHVIPDPDEGFWSTFRDIGNYDEMEEGEFPAPGAGFKYTSEGFQTIAPVFGGSATPKLHVQTSNPVDLKDGFYMEFRIDEFSYKGESGGEDEWISVHVSDRRMIGQGGTTWSNYWCTLIRGAGAGAQAEVQSFIGVKTTEEKPGTFTHKGSTNVKDHANADGQEVYTLAITWNGSAYDVQLNGTTVAGMADVSNFIAGLEQTYVGITLHSGQKGGVANLTILKQGTCAEDATVPSGTASKEPDENLLVEAPIADSSTVEAGKPALIFDGYKTSFFGNPGGSNIDLAATGNYTYHVTASGEVPYFMWNIKPSASYEAADFPIFVMMLKDYYGNDGGVYYMAGDVVSASNDYTANWSLWDEYSMSYGEDDQFSYVVLDMALAADEAWAGRINGIRPHFGVDPSDPEQAEWDIEFCAFFRTVEDAHAYGEAYLAEKYNIDTDATDPETVPETDPETDPETNAGEDKETTAGTTDGTAAGTDGEDKTDDSTGCASVIGFGSVAVLAAAAAFVALKKKD